MVEKLPVLHKPKTPAIIVCLITRWRETVSYETNADLNNVITANMTLEIATLPVTGQNQSQSWTLSANGTGFRRGDARVMAEERILKQIETDTKMSLGL
ncbi:MAG: hypothetical protein P4N60_18495 [Verrucomicrobiae bacterium]|nr:hypothetical protein [Verrucomicrobiae bacterium]